MGELFDLNGEEFYMGWLFDVLSFEWSYKEYYCSVKFFLGGYLLNRNCFKWFG